MFRDHRLVFSGYTAFIFLLLVSNSACNASDNNHCAPSCGNIHNISYPFRLKRDPKNCGKREYELACENNLTVLYLKSGKYYVEAINYDNFTIRLVDAGIHKGNCSSTPFYTLTKANFGSFPLDPYKWYKAKWTQGEYFPELSKSTLVFLKCPNSVNSPSYVDTASCLNRTYSSNSTLSHPIMHSYVLVGPIYPSEIEVSCRVEHMVMLSSPIKKDRKNISYMDIYKDLLYGVELSWFSVYCRNCFGRSCYLDDTNKSQCSYPGLTWLWKIIGFPSYFLIIFSAAALIVLGLYHGVAVFFGTPCVIAFLIYKWRRRHFSMYDTIEEFLECHNNLMPVRYSYSDIKKMTNGFKDKLGEGGFGTVYKGKLRSGYLAAVKILGKSKANGQDFINEVATIGRIHHVNVVQLIGFCVEGSKRALVYAFMPNGSLDKYIFSREGYISLSWEKMLEISLGVTRGIEYLHRGCEMQILHFDIKPHNILLDENFIPKISDFGLAKLYPTDGSIVSLTAARGTIGYIAPELFYKNIGGVSYKADVYSFGMLLMEMAGKRKNLNALADHSSQIYFPFWVYDQVVGGQDVEIGDATEEEKKIAKKMIIVALWCIQMKPCNRPSMNKVIEMLEGEVESLELPPKPVLYPEEAHVKKDGDSANQTGSSNTSNDFAETISLIVDAGET